MKEDMKEYKVKDREKDINEEKDEQTDIYRYRDKLKDIDIDKDKYP